MPAPAESLWQQAASFAARAHRNQLRMDGATPYVAHPFRVAMVLRHVFACEDETALASALLHDTIEDTTTDYDDLAGAFSPVIADIVAALTKNMALPLEHREADYDRRLASADWRARLIKLADIYDNSTDRRGLSAEGAAKLPARVQRALALAARDRAAHPETDRAVRAVEALGENR